MINQDEGDVFRGGDLAQQDSQFLFVLRSQAGSDFVQ
jgi:hypothetical protein